MKDCCIFQERDLNKLEAMISEQLQRGYYLTHFVVYDTYFVAVLVKK